MEFPDLFLENIIRILNLIHTFDKGLKCEVKSISNVSLETSNSNIIFIRKMIQNYDIEIFIFIELKKIKKKNN